jgi:hypothetical protein
MRKNQAYTQEFLRIGRKWLRKATYAQECAAGSGRIDGRGTVENRRTKVAFALRLAIIDGSYNSLICRGIFFEKSFPVFERPAD